MPPLNERSYRIVQTRWRIAVLLVIAAILFAPIQTAKGIGSRNIALHSSGPVADKTQIRVALVLRRNAAFLRSGREHTEIKWQTVLPETNLIEDQITVVTGTPYGLLMPYRTTTYPYQDAVAVEYRTAGEKTRIRLIPFELGAPSSTIVVDVPREPPSDAEAMNLPCPGN